MKAIVTKYLGPTNFKGSRIKASAEGVKSVTVGHESALNQDENHAAAAFALAEKMGWGGRWVMGGLPDGNFVFVCLDYTPGAFPEMLHPAADGQFEPIIKPQTV